ncbi:DNA-binding winged helix-turn-helix (wHTH) domain-containing protein [Granulicella rosea]|uniref:DNA-binding winged helix-turn-helix (WHTH) domain-containing protein n=1 Tax=Granulicella rosea TaxID=474952 RepID=A0A239EFK8_9BACT|nr:winged helix-turn-helix domain-containing protein [Granulicella rosea]SNS42682.1 DNA-binding winged helix-turn-helix (wHTH) domain-containing protein [Granulicella rosea]
MVGTASTAHANRHLSPSDRPWSLLMLLETQRRIRFEGYLIDRAAWELQWQDETIALNRKTFDLLLFLIDHRDRVVSKEELLQSLWRDQFVEESNLTQHVFLLRKALSRHGSGQRIVETVSGRGYRFTAPLEVEPQEPEEVATTSQVLLHAKTSVTEITIEEEETDAAPSAPAFMSQGSRRNRTRWAVAGSLVAIGLATAGWFGWQHWLDRTGGAPVDVVIAPLAGSTGDQVLDSALVDALRMDLSQSPFVSVVAPARVRATLAEMKQDPNAAMTAAAAAEVCERTNSQAVLHGSIARTGRHFLVTEEATSCVNGSPLAEAKQEVSTLEDLPHGIDKLAEGIRQRLGESRRSIARFDVPLFPGRTASLEALKDFTQGELQSNQGKYVDAIALFKKAVAADPSFAEAQYDLAATSGSVLDLNAEREALLKAYALRDSASEPIRLGIIALYHVAVTQDLYESERNYRNWTELYPRSAQAWNGLSIVERDLGHHQEALAAAEHALELRPAIAGLYANLAFEQIKVGNPRGALDTCQRALAKGMDVDYVREHCFQAAYALHDAAQVQQQREWCAAHRDAVYIRMDEIDIAIAEGRFADAVRLTPALEAIMRQRGMSEPADGFIRDIGDNLIESGDVADGVRILRSAPVDPKDEISVLGLARVGDFAAAESALRAMQSAFPQGTLWNDYRGPEIQAVIALATHRPKDAIDALERARPLEGRDPVISLLRGDAYLAAGQPAQAETAYRKVVDGPDQQPEAEEIPLSWLGLGRAYAAEGNRPAAIQAYERFLSLWAHADSNAVRLVEAKSELGALQNGALQNVRQAR